MKVLNKRGSHMIEAAIVLPVVILSVMLLLRLFTFYLEILCTGVSEHEKALAKWNSYEGVSIDIYHNEETVSLLPGGLLSNTASKLISTDAYLVNEDSLVRIKMMGD